MSWLLYRLGLAFRETGQALDRVGCVIASTNAYKEPIYRHRTVSSVNYLLPKLGEKAFVAPSAAVSGDVSVGAGSSVWYGAVVRGDDGKITIGANTNLQDGVTVLSGSGQVGGHMIPTEIGNNVTIGHGATLLGVTLGDETLIGMGSTLLQGVEVEKGSMVAAGAVVAAGTIIPPGELWAGVPARKLRDLKPNEASFMGVSADTYHRLSGEHSEQADRRPPFQ